MRVKIQGGTVKHGEPTLCQTCRHATIVRGPRLEDEIVECGRFYSNRGRIVFPVVSCSGYSDRRQASLREMEEIAWVLRSDTSRGTVGFVRSSKLTDQDRFILEED
jgi:hypothetical protein